MKRYTIVDDNGLLNGINEMQTLNGKWVTYNDCQIEIIRELDKQHDKEIQKDRELIRLKELNREMVEAMKQNCDICYKERDLDVCEECMFDKFINKAEEGEGE